MTLIFMLETLTTGYNFLYEGRDSAQSTKMCNLQQIYEFIWPNLSRIGFILQPIDDAIIKASDVTTKFKGRTIDHYINTH